MRLSISYDIPNDFLIVDGRKWDANIFRMEEVDTVSLYMDEYETVKMYSKKDNAKVTNLVFNFALNDVMLDSIIKALNGAKS